MSNNSTGPRRVLSQAVDLWREIYSFLITSAEPKNQLAGSSPNQTTIASSVLQSFEPADPNAPVAFWMGLTTDRTPIVAVSNETGATLSGNVIYNGQVVAASTVSSYITDWQSFCTEQDPPGSGAYVNDYVFVKFYWYTWADISNLTAGYQYDLNIEIIAQTIGADNQFFQADIKDPNHTTEGYIALDLLLTPDDGVTSPRPDHYDFVKPCPRICPNN